MANEVLTMANEIRKKHLVTDNPLNMTESMLNYAYTKNGKVYLRYANDTEDIDLCEYVSQLTEKVGCNISAEAVMQGYCIEGCDCEVALFYGVAIQAAELRERLKYYETLEDQGLLQTLPCKVGQTVYVIRFNEETRWIEEYLVKYFYSSSKGIDRIYAQCGTDSRSFRPRHFGKSVFLTKAEAEQKLKEMRGGNDL